MLLGLLTNVRGGTRTPSVCSTDMLVVCGKAMYDVVYVRRRHSVNVTTWTLRNADHADCITTNFPITADYAKLVDFGNLIEGVVALSSEPLRDDVRPPFACRRRNSRPRPSTYHLAD